MDATIFYTSSFPVSNTIPGKFYPSQMKPFFITIPIMFFIRFPISSYPIRPHSISSVE